MMIGNGWMGRGGVLLSVLALPGCGFIFGDDAEGGGSGAPPTDDPYPMPEEDPGTPEEAFDEECVPQAWIDEAREDATWGAPARFQIDGSQVSVDAQQSTIEAVPAPFTVALASPSVVVIEAASIVDGPSGTVVIAGASFGAEEGALVPASTEALSFTEQSAVVVPLATTDDGARPDLGVDADPADVAALQANVPFEMTVEHLGVTSYERAYVVTEQGNVPLTGAFVVSDASRVYWPAGSAVYAQTVEASFSGEVFIGLEPLAGEFSVRGEPAEALPLAILGRDARLVVGPSHVQTIDPMPVRQALDAYGALVGADMQLRRCMPDMLVMYPGERRIVELAVRERGGATDGAFAAFTVQAEGGTEWPARIELDPTMPDVLTVAAQTHAGSTWGQSLGDFFEAWAEVTRAVTEGIVCVFTLGFLCPDSSASPPEPTPLAPYPAWAEPSSIHAFEVELTAPSTPGEYTISFVAEGQNYDATIAVDVLVED